MRATVQPFFHADSNTWSYVVADPATRAAAIVDPVLDFDLKSGRTTTASAQALLDHIVAQRLSLQWILETHAHADHLTAAHWLRTRVPEARVAIGAGIRTVQTTFRAVYNLGHDFDVDGSQFDHLFTDNEAFLVGTLAARVFAVPGHTPDSVAYLIDGALFPGDSLFMPDGGTARCDFPGGDAATLYRSIRRLYAALPDSTRVFVCHDYGPNGREVACETTLGAQRRDNIHLRDGIDEATYVQLRTTRDATLAMPALLLPAVQVNIRAGALPDAEANGVRYLKLPLDQF